MKKHGLEEAQGSESLSRAPAKSLHDTYVTKDAFLKEVPRLIISTICGIDIDPRYSDRRLLGLRAQKAWQRRGLLRQSAIIRRSNIVCLSQCLATRANEGLSRGIL